METLNITDGMNQKLQKFMQQPLQEGLLQLLIENMPREVAKNKAPVHMSSTNKNIPRSDAKYAVN